MPPSRDEAAFHSFQIMSRAASGPAPASAAESRRSVLDLSVIIVNYNVREFLEQALRSVCRAGDGLEMEVFVVDNNSVDGSAAMVRSEFPHVHLIVNEENVGFSRANNQAIRRARGRFLLVLNPDTIVQEDTFAKLLEFMRAHPDAGAVGCKILHPDGSFARESRRAFPTPRVAFYRMTGLATAFPRSKTFGRYNMTYLPEDEPAEVDALSGSCMLVRHAALYRSRERSAADRERAAAFAEDDREHPAPQQHERNDLSDEVGAGLLEEDGAVLFDEGGAGLLDEDFFMYGEDLDWCYRIQQAGWKIYYTPETAIIHYKGESTKKGELRYVRLFYGAMLRFTEKHFELRYSNVFAALLRVGIFIRAGLSVAFRTLRRLAWPLLDFTTVYVISVIIAAAHAASLDVALSPLFFAAVAPAYGLGAVTGIAMLGGYGRRRRIRSVWGGLIVGLLVVASASFFVKNIAFSRFVVLVTFPLAATAASFTRLVILRHERRQTGVRHALLVGPRSEAERLEKMLVRHPRPPFVLDGYVDPETHSPAPNGRHARTRVAALGRVTQLRDIVRLRGIDDVVFASAALSNRTMFWLIQRLRDLPVHFRILAEGREHVIGKASVDDLSMVNLVEAEDTLVHTRSPLARRSFEIAASLAGLLLHPFVAAAARIAGSRSAAERWATRTRQLPAVLRGDRSLVGFDPDTDYVPPEEWGLKAGVFAVDDALEIADVGTDEIGAAYWYYVRNQSASLDCDIILHALKGLRRQR